MSSTPPLTPPPKKEDSILDYLKANVRETICYILLVLGILLIYFEPLYGGLLVGIVGGIYFGDEIMDFFKYWKDFLDKEGIAKCLVLTGLALAFFIAAPAIFVGIAIAIAIKQIFNSTKEGSSTPPSDLPK